MEEQYQGRVEATLEFVLTLSSEDFKGLIGARRLYKYCLGPEPSKFVLEKIALEERSMLFLLFNDEQFSLYRRLVVMNNFLYNDKCLSFAEMSTRQSKDKYARLRSMKSEPLSSLAPDAKRRKFGKGKFEGPTPLALFQASISPTPSANVVAALPLSAAAPPVTCSKRKGKVRKSILEDPTTAVG